MTPPSPRAKPRPVTVVGYDPAWPRRYADVAAAIRRAVGSRIPRLEHVGSTSVPGCRAKPILDVMGGVSDLADAEAARPALERLGFAYRPEYEDEMPYRRYFTQVNAVHFHVVEVDHEFWTRHLAFRDWLRTHDEDREAYGDLKTRLAAEYGTDRRRYTDAKTDFIRAIEAKAGCGPGR